MCVFMFFLGEACTGGAQEQGIERSTDSVRNPNWFHVPPAHPPPPSPALRNAPPRSFPHPYPTFPHLSTPTTILPPTLVQTTTAWGATPTQRELQMELGVGKMQKWLKTKERSMYPVHSSQKKECFRSVSNERKRKKKSNWQVTVVFVNTSFFCYIQYDTSSKSIDCSVPFLYISFFSLHIWM